MPDIRPSRVENNFIVIFNVLACLGLCSTLAVLGPAIFSSRVNRSRTWFGVLTSWMLYSASYLLLIGRQRGPDPSFGLCMFQATLVYATSPLCAATTMCFALDFFLKLSTTSPNNRLTGLKTARMLVIFPWVLAFVIVGEAMLSVNDASKIKRNINNFYCHIASPIPPLTNAVIVVLCIIIIVPLEIYTGIRLYRNWTLFRRLSATRAQIALSTLIRLALFSLMVSLALVLTIISATRIHRPRLVPAWHMILISLPTFSALCFGTQRDILEVWIFWRREETNPVSPSDTAEACIDIGNDPRIKLDA